MSFDPNNPLNTRLVSDSGGPTKGADKPSPEMIAAFRGISGDAPVPPTAPVPPNVATPVVPPAEPPPTNPSAPTPAPTIPETPPVAAVPPPVVPPPASPTSPAQPDITAVLQSIAEGNRAVVEAVQAAKPKVEDPPKPAPKIEDLFTISEEEGDAIISGGKTAADALKNIQLRQMNLMATLVQGALHQMREEHITPISKWREQQEIEATKQRFFSTYPDLKDWDNEVRQVAGAVAQSIQTGKASFADEASFFKAVNDGVRSIQTTLKQRLGVRATPTATPVAPPPHHPQPVFVVQLREPKMN